MAAAAAGAMALTLAPSAFAAQYITQLEYDKDGSIAPGSYGTVTVTDKNDGVHGDYVNVLVQLDPTLVDSFVDTGSHVMFAFNLVDSPASTVSFVQPLNLAGLTYTGGGDFDNSPFMNFTDAIQYKYQGKGNGNNTLLSPLEFNVYNTNGISFLGAGNHFTSTTGGGAVGGFTGGWWFSADISAPDGRLESPTFTVAGRDFCIVGSTCGGAVPEPATWSLMILGFGSAGAMLRRRRRDVFA
jgi:hypothetical protein